MSYDNRGRHSAMEGPADQPSQEVQPAVRDGADLESRFGDPGLPAHRHRVTDIDEKAARRAERQVAGMFVLSILGSILFVVGFFAFPLTSDTNVARNRLFTGLGLGIAMFAIGAAAVHWAKKLMPDEELVEERHPIRSTDEERAAALGVVREGGEAAGFGRRKLIWGSMVGAMGALALPAVVSLRDLWWRHTDERPEQWLKHTMWGEGVRLVTDPFGAYVRPEEIPVGAVVHVLPEGLASPTGGQPEVEGEGGEEADIHLLDEQNKAATLLIRIEPDKLEPESAQWAYNGIVAFSQICTHVGCPVALYEHKTHHLLCPCHQSTFDVTQGCKVIFGPASRPLPQLAITVDDEGYLVAQGDYQEPVGPSFWELRT